MTNKPKSFAVNCPRCGETTRWEGNAWRPFCSVRCRQIDLGAWVDEEYRVATEPADPAEVEALLENSQKTTEWS